MFFDHVFSSTIISSMATLLHFLIPRDKVQREMCLEQSVESYFFVSNRGAELFGTQTSHFLHLKKTVVKINRQPVSTQFIQDEAFAKDEDGTPILEVNPHL